MTVSHKMVSYVLLLDPKSLQVKRSSCIDLREGMVSVIDLLTETSVQPLLHSSGSWRFEEIPQRNSKMLKIKMVLYTETCLQISPVMQSDIKRVISTLIVIKGFCPYVYCFDSRHHNRNTVCLHIV